MSKAAPFCALLALILIWFRMRALKTFVIPRTSEFDRKLHKLIAGGKDKLQIVADFDRTGTQ
jgi:hypothetical protein